MAGKIIGVIPNGAVVNVYGRYNDWYVVSYKSKYGYASSDFVAL
jgi:uncharacterized protein YraI